MVPQLESPVLMGCVDPNNEIITPNPNVESVTYGLLDKNVDISSTRCLPSPVKPSVRAGYMRVSNLPKLQAVYLKWVRNNIFVGFKVDVEDLYMSSRKLRYGFFLAQKRGNKKYADTVKRKMRDFNDTLPKAVFYDVRAKRRVQTTPMFKVVLTGDPNVKHTYRERNELLNCYVDKTGKGLYPAWSSIGSEVNRFRSNMRKYFGCEISIIHTWEDFKKKGSRAYGYPHVNLIVMLKGKKVRTFYHNGEWRLKCKRDLEKYWHSHIDVKAVSQIGEYDDIDYPENNESYISLSHNLKYITKDLRECREGDKYVLLNAILWCMRKRAFSFNGSFLKQFLEVSERLDKEETISNFPELELMKKPGYVVKITGIGVFPGCIFKCIKRLRGKFPVDCPYYRFSNQLELRYNEGISKFNCGPDTWGYSKDQSSILDSGLNYYVKPVNLDGLGVLCLVSRIIQTSTTYDFGKSQLYEIRRGASQ